VKQTIYSISHALGVNRLSASVHRNRPIILTFHGVTADVSDTICNDEGLHLHRPLFERLMKHVARHYNPVPVGRIIDWLEGGDVPLERAVGITFDDGFRNVLTEAAPVLKKHGIPATLFVTTDFVFKQEMLWPDRLISAIALTHETSLEINIKGLKCTFHFDTRANKLLANAVLNKAAKELPQAERLALLDEVEAGLKIDRAARFSAWEGFRPIDPDEMRLFPHAGITVGAHTCSHPIMARLTAQEQARELSESKRLIESITGVACDEFAYPNGGPGDFNAATRERVADAGYRCAFTTVKQRVSRGGDRFEIPRCTLTHNRVTLAEFSAELSGWPGAVRARLNRPGARTGAESATSPRNTASSSRKIA
jgi:peptidoglycan/xylan/chitin deacetylase (PgdA/CDA1 family)